MVKEVLHLMVDRTKKGDQVYNFEKPVPRDSLPPFRPYLKKFPEVLKIIPLAGDQMLNT
jgi:hypothetical protein